MAPFYHDISFDASSSDTSSYEQLIPKTSLKATYKDSAYNPSIAPSKSALIA